MRPKMHPVVVRKEIKVWWQATEEVLREGEAGDDLKIPLNEPKSAKFALQIAHKPSSERRHGYLDNGGAVTPHLR